MIKKKITPYYLIGVILLVILAILFTFPLYWIVTGAFKTAASINAPSPEWWPGKWVLDNFRTLMGSQKAPLWVILIPLIREMSTLNLYDSIWAVIFPTVGWPFGVFLMKQFSEGIPGELIEAARIDGASELKTFNSIVVPMVKPGIGALAIFTFINNWNDYFMQLIMLSSTKHLTISLGIAKLQAENSTDFGLIMAGATLAAAPILMIFLAFQKYFTQGIAMGAVKG